MLTQNIPLQETLAHVLTAASNRNAVDFGYNVKCRRKIAPPSSGSKIIQATMRVTDEKNSSFSQLASLLICLSISDNELAS
jgi:hypothetical protein